VYILLFNSCVKFHSCKKFTHWWDNKSWMDCFYDSPCRPMCVQLL